MNDLCKKLSSLIFVLSLSSAVKAQGYQIESMIQNAKGEAVPFAHVYLTQSSGTIANGNGAFKLYIPEGVAPDQQLTITAIGYKSRTISIANLPKVILMSEDLRMLREVVVVPKDYARQLIKEAVARISENYPSWQERHNGFLREQTSWISDPDSLLYVVEATLESTKSTYEKSTKSGELKVTKSRRYNTRGLDSVFTKIVAGTHHTYRFDAVARRDLFLKNDDPFDFTIEDTLRSQGDNIIEVNFSHKNESPFGTVLIEEKSKAIASMEVNYPTNFPVSYADSERIYFEYKVHYFKAPDSFWRFLKSDYQTHFRKKGDTLMLASSYIATSHERNDESIPYLERFQSTSAVLENEETYESTFWQNYNIMAADEKTELLFQRGSPSITDTLLVKKLDKKLKFFNALSRLRLSYDFQLTAVEVAPYNITYANPSLNISESEVSVSNKLSYAYSFSILYETLPKLWIGYSNGVTFDNSGISSHDLMAMSEINLNPKGRPISLAPWVRIGHQRTNVFLDSYSSENEFQVDGKKFDSGQTEVYLSQKSFRVQPGLRFTIEKSERTTFFIGAAYNLPLTSTDGLYFRETDQFFLTRKKKFLKNGNETLQIDAPQELLQNTLTVEFGILLGR